MACAPVSGLGGLGVLGAASLVVEEAGAWPLEPAGHLGGGCPPELAARTATKTRLQKQVQTHENRKGQTRPQSVQQQSDPCVPAGCTGRLGA